MSGDIIPFRSRTREEINLDSEPCAEQIEKLRSALGMQQLYVDADTQRLIRIDTATSTPQIKPISQDALVEIAARAYNFVRVGKGGSKQVSPPPPVVRAVLADPGELPRLRRIVDVPYLTPSGRVVYQHGYDAETGTYLHLDHEIDPVPDRPTDAQLADAAQIVAYDMLDGWQFADAASRANAIASVVTYYLRTLYPELLAPIHLVDAPDNNYGKTQLAQTLVAPLVGESPDVTQMRATDRTECRRTIYSLLRAHPTAIILDNVADPIAGDAIASVLTARRTRDRQIKSSTAPSVVNDALWYATGTLITTSREMAIRAVLTQLTAPPIGNRDPIAWATEHRVEIVRAHLVIMRRWIVDGRTLDKTCKHPKYPRWSELVGGVLRVMGVADLLANQQTLLAARDDESRAWIDLVERWAALQGGPALHRRVTDILNGAIVAGEPAYDIVADGRDHDARKKILGHALRRRDGVTIGGWRVHAVENKHAKVHEYWIDPVAPATAPPTPPSAPRTPRKPATPTKAAHAPQRTPQDSKNPARTPHNSSVENNRDKRAVCGVCGVLSAHNTPHTCAHARVARSQDQRTPQHPAAGSASIARAIDSWATTGDDAIATDPNSVLARVVERERRGGRS